MFPREDPLLIEHGRWLFAQECNFIAGAATLDIIPPMSTQEVAFVGRSNVGKSSLINALTGRKTLARISHTPGRTAQLNFFLLGEKLTLVDLPGYGYAKVSKRTMNDWDRLIKGYLMGRAQLRRVCLLIDARHGIKTTDIDIMDLLDDAGVSYQIVLTKTDKATQADVAKIIAYVQTLFVQHPALYPDVIATSSRDRIGVPDLQAECASFIQW